MIFIACNCPTPMQCSLSGTLPARRGNYTVDGKGFYCVTLPRYVSIPQIENVLEITSLVLHL